VAGPLLLSPEPAVAVATPAATSRSSIPSIPSRNPDVLDGMDALDVSDTRVTRLRAWSTLSGWRFESSSAHGEPPAQRAVPASSRRRAERWFRAMATLVATSWPSSRRLGGSGNAFFPPQHDGAGLKSIALGGPAPARSSKEITS
jgi:hypothetical protein